MPLHPGIRFLYEFLLFVSCLISSQNAALSFNFSFSDIEGTPQFNHLVVDKNEGRVFIGAVNRLYQLSPNLDLEVNYTTNPENSLKCTSGAKELHNYNKALVIDYAKSRLIACGSNFNGICTVHNMKNISNKIYTPCESIVNNRENVSTVAFITQVDSNNASSMSKFYVGVTYPGNSTYLSNAPLPLIAARSLEDNKLFKIVKQGETDASIYLNSKYLRTYPINYVYGFSLGPYSYFLTIQKNSSIGPFSYISKIIRMCSKNDNSYIEIPIECIDERKNINYNLVQTAFIANPNDEFFGPYRNKFQGPVLFVMFAKGKQPEGNESNVPSNQSALCVYSLSAIDYELILNAVKCHTGNGFKGSKSIPLDKPCTKTGTVNIDSDLCMVDVKGPQIGGLDPVKSEPVLKFNTTTTAINVASTGKFTVVFIGNHTGFLHKIVMNGEKAEKYAEERIDEGSLVISLQFDVKKENLYVLTEHKLIRMPVQFCHEHQTGRDCIDRGDPYCGWCLSANKCTLVNECDGVKKDPFLWIPFNIRKQVSITKIDPETAPLHDSTHTNLTLTVENFPSINENLFCEFTFSNKILNTNGTRMKNTISCLTPDPKDLPPTQKGDVANEAKLSIKTVITDFGPKKYKFYDCEAHTFCSTCVKSSRCDWYVKKNMCVYKRACDSNDHISKDGRIFDEKDCPSTKLIGNDFPEILIPDGTLRSIEFKTYNFHYFPASTEYFCRFNIGGTIFTKNAYLNNNLINCEETEFIYLQQQPNITVKIHVLRDEFRDPIDKPEKMHLFIYKCVQMANNRSSCLTLDEKYKCGWCNHTNYCEMVSESYPISTNWSKYCDMPSKASPFLYFAPKIGPCGASVRIRNNTWKYSFGNIRNSITVAGTPCIPLSDQHISNTLITCRMSVTMPCKDITQGPVIVRVGGFYSESKDNYTIVDPKIIDIFPKQGPLTGDTELTIQGKYMNTGATTEVFINNLPCIVYKRNFTALKCVTTAARWPSKEYVVVKFDNIMRIYENKFEYRNNLPLEPNSAFVPKGTPQGGNKILISGTDLMEISKADIQVILDRKNPTKFYSGDCNVLNNSVMECLSPVIPDIINCSMGLGIPEFLHYVINTNIANSNGNIQYLGPSFNKRYGRFVLYCEPIYDPNFRNSINSSSVKEIAFVIIIIASIVVPVLFILLKKLTKTKKARKKMQEQIDKLELCVAAECKEAFAELQTEISDSMVRDMPESLPFWDYRTYVMKILFPNITDHSTILCVKPELTNKKKELQLFNQLITNKTFLLIFIRTLENDESFSMNDRVFVASMIMITLQNEMEYCTDVIKTLLTLLIEKSLKRPSQPKLLLRQTESVVEKMLTAWFTFLLHKFLRECAGKPLFTLFKAIKQQLNKGPIDEITCEARYSLNENKLIRKHINYASITVYVSVSQQTAADTGLKSAVENIPVKMLDCDTIFQAKEKAVNAIYFAVDYSKRPKPSELDLEFMTELSGNMTLYNTDFSSEIQGEWKRRNTLKHYGVDEGSMLNLVLIKQDSNPIQNPRSVNEEELPVCDKLKSTIMECATSKIYRAKYKSVPDIDTYYKEWHLVKPNQLNDNQIHYKESNMVSEVYLTRLLSTKGTLQKFVDDLFVIIFSVTSRSDCFPIAIKYMFDFLDDQAREHNIIDPQVVHIWKSNCLPLRFWVNLIKNPDFLFDIHKSNIMDSCLSVVAQAFMDSCSIEEHLLSKNSSTAKLLYAKDIPSYKNWVTKYYSDIKAMPAIPRDDMNAMLGKESQLHCMDFNTNAAIYELYKYAVKYKEQLLNVLRDQCSQKYNLTNKFEEVLDINSRNNDSDNV